MSLNRSYLQLTLRGIIGRCVCNYSDLVLGLSAHRLVPVDLHLNNVSECHVNRSLLARIHLYLLFFSTSVVGSNSPKHAMSALTRPDSIMCATRRAFRRSSHIRGTFDGWLFGLNSHLPRLPRARCPLPLVIGRPPLKYTMTVTLDLGNASGEPSTRRTLSNLSLSVAKCKKIVVVTGAGISCSCGIPVGVHLFFRGYVWARLSGDRTSVRPTVSMP